MWDYVEFFLRLNKRVNDYTDLSDNERYVVACLEHTEWQGHHYGDTDWLPVGRAMSIQSGSENREKEAAIQLKDAVFERLDVVTAHLDEIEGSVRQGSSSGSTKLKNTQRALKKAKIKLGQLIAQNAALRQRCDMTGMHMEVIEDSEDDLSD